MIKKTIISLLLLIAVSPLYSNGKDLANTELIVCELNVGDEFIDSVEAQDMYGKESKYFSVYRRRIANGTYYYFVQVKGVEYTLYFIERNKYKPYYFNMGGENRWYFSSRRLDELGAYRVLPK